MGYAVVTFLNDNSISEVPTTWFNMENDKPMCWWPPNSIKNVSTLIAKKSQPNKNTWMLLAVKIEKFCDSLQKARKIANDLYCSSTDEDKLGKGQRKKNINCFLENEENDNDINEKERANMENVTNISQRPRNKYQKPLTSSINYIDTSSDDENVNEGKTLGKKQLPEWPEQNCDKNDNYNNARNDNDNSDTSSINSKVSSDNNELVQETHHEEHGRAVLIQSESQTKVRNDADNAANQMKNRNDADNASANQINDRNDASNTKLISADTIHRIDENVRILIRIMAQCEQHIVDVSQQVDRITPHTQISVRTDNIKKYFPLKSIDEIKGLETILKEDIQLTQQLKTFIQKVGGDTAKENIRNVLAKIFSNKCAIKCSWKGRRENFGVANLLLMKIVAEMMLDSHGKLTYSDFNNIGAEWFRFAKQRYDRQEKNQ